MSLMRNNIVLVVATLMAAASVCAQVPNLVFSSAADNDLYTSAVGTFGVNYDRYSDPLTAVQHAPNGSGVMILADGYPDITTSIQKQVLNEAAAKNLKLYIEYPGVVPGPSLGDTFRNSVERIVTDTNTFFGADLQQWDILDPHEAAFVSVNSSIPDANQHFRLARVAGFNHAVYQYSGITPRPMLFEHSNSGVDMLISTTKLSNFVTGRYMPNDRWQSAWSGVLSWLDGSATNTDLEWTPVQRPTYGRNAPLPPSALREAINRGIDWYTKGRHLIHEDWFDDYVANRELADIHQPWPDAGSPVGDGSLGVLEGTANPLYDNGEQAIRWWVRSDNLGPTAMAYALQGLATNSDQSKTIANNLLTNLNDPNREISGGPRADPTNPGYGQYGWTHSSQARNSYWSEIAGRVSLNQMAVAAALNTDEWDETIVRSTLAGLRLTGTTGFWATENIRQEALEANGWELYHNSSGGNLRPHFESSKWAPFLWLYDKTGYQPLYDRTREGISRVMTAYNAGNLPWTNGIQQERSRLLISLAWLVRAEDTPEHRQWLNTIAGDIIADMDESGAIQEELGVPGLAYFPPPGSNLAFGTNEAPVIQENGDKASDLLYSMNFAYMGMIEAAAVTGDPVHQQAVADLTDFFIRVQTTSSMPELDSAWVRTFDFERWDYWGSDSDHGWGVLGTQGGWTQAEIVASMSLVDMNTSLWELTANSSVNDVFEDVRRVMFPGPAVEFDLNDDGVFDIDDYLDVFIANLSRDLSGLGLSPGESEFYGDFDGNLRVDIFDFRQIKDAYNKIYGEGAFARALAVPEPASSIACTVVLTALLGLRSY